MQTYYVAGNLNHDGRDYRRGDTIELAPETAASLIEAGVLSTEPIAAVQKPEPEAPAAAESTEEVVVGGTAPTSGEPSLDGPGSDQDADTAREVGPHASGAPEGDQPIQEPKPQPEAPAAARRGRRTAGQAIVDPAIDPSANL